MHHITKSKKLSKKKQISNPFFPKWHQDTENLRKLNCVGLWEKKKSNLSQEMQINWEF